MTNFENVCRHVQTHGIGTELCPLRPHVEDRPELLTVASGEANAFEEINHGLTSAFYARYIPSRRYPCYWCGRNFFKNQIEWFNGRIEIFICKSCYPSMNWGFTREPVANNETTT